ncbi:MAG: HAMP domain-containing histidine kinase [Porticoccaceae bacterium]|nr:HAMP domain-containing histidine kinase [Porticoccaceae bacterium]
MALFFTVLLGISVSFLAYFLNQFNESSLIREVELGIDSNIEAFQDWNMLAFDLVAPLEVLENMAQNHQNTWYVYYDSDNNVVYQDIKPPSNQITTLREGIIRFDLEPESFLTDADFEGTRMVAAKIHTFRDGSRLLVAQDIEDALTTRQLMRTLGMVTMALMTAVIATSFFISNYVVALTNRIAGTSREIIATGDLSRRIDVNTNWDDLSNLAEILNHMLDRIEELLDGVRRVSDNIAHDLRTPLSRLRNHLEELENLAGKDPQMQESTQALIGEADHILDTFRALLRISNIESGKRHSEFGTASVSEIVEDIFEFYEPLAEEKQVELKTEIEEVNLNCDRDLLFQAIANLVDNAIKFSPANSNVKIRLSKASGRVLISVSDQGEGVSDEDKNKIFDRFYRAEKSRNSAGNGLGLSLVAAIIELHAGQIELSDNNPGLRVKVSLPL